ncbi:hypothetical protein J2Y55_003343 [Bosea sp. BE125]|nr:hypothetical protein [Bosea sp. BE125]
MFRLEPGIKGKLAKRWTGCDQMSLSRHGRACPDHPRRPLSRLVFKTWMLATRASMTAGAPITMAFAVPAC